MQAGLLGIPLGGVGSGRARYAAAMALYQSGQIGHAQLEAYRIAAASDRAPPDALFAERGLPLPDRHPVHSLIDAADGYLQTLPGPGVVEVRAGMARFGNGLPRTAPRENAVLTAHLPAALNALRQTHPDLATAIALAIPHLTWITYDGYDPAQIGPDFAQGHAYASIIGEDATIPAVGFDFGLFLIAPHVLYRDHNHAAPELYAPLTGPHGWRFAPGAPLDIRAAHHPVWNPSFQPHLTKVGPVPFLAFFGWTAEVTALARVIPADDWPELEALRLAI